MSDRITKSSLLASLSHMELDMSSSVIEAKVDKLRKGSPWPLPNGTGSVVKYDDGYEILPREAFDTVEPPPDANKLAERQEELFATLDANFVVYSEAGETEIYRVDASLQCVLQTGKSALYNALYDAMPSLTDRDVASLVSKWTNSRESKDKLLKERPAAYAFASETKHALKKLSWDIAAQPGETPAWKEFLGRLTDEDAFSAFIYSIFVPNDPCRQVLWLHGPGNSGKSQIFEVLNRVLGAAAQKLHSALDYEHGTASLLGARLVYDSERDFSPGFFRHRTVKTISGGDSLRINPKGGKVIDVVQKMKLAIASNNPPDLGNTEEERSRCLPIAVTSQTPEMRTADWIQRLEEQLPLFLAHGRECYGRLLKGSRLTVAPKTEALLNANVGASEEEFDFIFETLFDESNGATVTGSVMVEKVHKPERFSPARKVEWGKYLASRGVEVSRSTRQTTYTNIKLKVVPSKAETDSATKAAPVAATVKAQVTE